MLEGVGLDVLGEVEGRRKTVGERERRGKGRRGGGDECECGFRGLGWCGVGMGEDVKGWDGGWVLLSSHRS